MNLRSVTIGKVNGLPTRLPGPGYHFQPTDEELIQYYLKNKVMSSPLPANIIPELNVYGSDPWDFPGNAEEERYFFNKNQAKYPNGSRVNRAAISGYWKASGVDKEIFVPQGNDLVVGGRMKTLVFYTGKLPRTTKTDWTMQEFRMADAPAALKPNDQIRDGAAMAANWVLCRVFQKKKETVPNAPPPARSCNSDSSGDHELRAENTPTHQTDDEEESVNSCN